MRKPAASLGTKLVGAIPAAAVFPTSFPVIGIGSSAGGLDACITLLKSLKPDLGMAFVFIPHLASSGESIFCDLLSKATSMPAVDAEDGMRVQPDHVYVIPPRYDMTISQGKLRLIRLPQPRSSSKTVDIFLRSLAADQGRDAIGIILSGMASDGTLGMAAVKLRGGTTFAQDASAKFASMPSSAIAAGWVDLVLSPQAMAAELAHMDLLTKAAPHISKKLRREPRKAETNLPEGVQTHLPPGFGPSSGHLRLPLRTPAVVIAVVKSPRKLLRVQAQRTMHEVNQARLRFVGLELMLASTFCGVADTDAAMGNSASVLRLIGASRKAIASAQHYMMQAGGCPDTFKQQFRAEIRRIRQRIRQLERYPLQG